MDTQVVEVLAATTAVTFADIPALHIFYGVCWFIIIAWMFLAQHHTCDVYFVPAINVFVDKMRGSKNTWLQRWGEQSVAGATICALGCNGPELFSNLISLYTGSDAGIGVVVGSEIFNLLVIVGSSVLAAPIVPLALEKLSFTRDCLAYAISIIMLFRALQDRQIDFHESTTLLAAAVVYVVAVYFTKDLEKALGMGKDESTEESGARVKPSDASVQDNTKRAPSFEVAASEPSSDEIGRSKTDVKHVANVHGIMVEVREIFHGRMCDGHHDNPAVVMLDAGGDGIRKSSKGPAANTGGIQLESACEEALLGPMLKYDNLKEVTVMGEGVIELEFEKGVMAGMILEHITLVMTCATLQDRDELLKQITEHCGRAWVHGYDATIVGGWQHFQHQMADKDLSTYLKVVYVFPEFVVDSLLRATMFAVDVKDINNENRWPICFLFAMCWLAFFSWCMLECCNWINYYIPVIPISFLGITICAVGTSFPNAVASVILSSQNKPAAAIANALGSNIQNVFLAMAFPWVIFQVQKNDFKPIPQDVAGIQEGVLWMVGTLVLLLFFVLTPPCCKLTKFAGIFLNAVYGLYVITIMGETFGWWPPLIK